MHGPSPVRIPYIYILDCAIISKARTPAPVPPLGILALLARLRSRTPRARVRGELGLALQQCSRSCTPSANQLQLQCTAKTPLAGPPQTPVCDAPLARPFLATRRPRAPPRPPAASCAMHCTPLVQDLQGHTHTAPAPPHPSVQNARAAPHEGLTPERHTGRCWRRRDSGVGVERRREVRAPLS